MSYGDITIREGDVKLVVQDWGKLARKLDKAGADAGDMRQLMHELGMIVVRAARPLAPAKSRATRNSLRSGRRKTKAVVIAGGSPAPYAPVVHYGAAPGWKRSNGRPLNIKKNHWLLKAFKGTQPAVYNRLVTGLDEILKKNDLI